MFKPCNTMVLVSHKENPDKKSTLSEMSNNTGYILQMTLEDSSVWEAWIFYSPRHKTFYIEEVTQLNYFA